MRSKEPELPRPVHSAIEELWKTASQSEEAAFNSAAFRLLEVNCGSAYPKIQNSRLKEKPTSDWSQKELRLTLQNFFRWNGGPWYEGPSPDARETALQLHQTFLNAQVNRTYFVPLDRLDLEDSTHPKPQRLEQVQFGPNQVQLLKRADLMRAFRCGALKRFGHRYGFEIESLHDLHWLVVNAREEAGPIWKRTSYSVLHNTLDQLGRLPIFEATFPAPVENAVFVLLLCLMRGPSETPWQPFAIPWIYSTTDDWFAGPGACVYRKLHSAII